MRTLIYLGLLTGLFLGIGYLFGGEQGLSLALIIALVINMGSYWFSDKIVLALYRAKEMNMAEYPAVYRIIGSLTQQAGLPMPKVYKIDMPTPNAFATGRDPGHACIGITTGILSLLTEDELRGVLAHELSHIKNNDILVCTMAATLAGAISYLVHMIGFGLGRDEEGRGNPLVFLLLIIVTPLLAMLIQMAVSRTREYGADASGAHLLGHGHSLASALRKLGVASQMHPIQPTGAQQATASLFIVNPFKPSFLINLFSTHPPMEERIRRLEQM
ncbi:MAG: zinc metalloprotease HtpX [Patescibacteria group bacterium]